MIQAVPTGNTTHPDTIAVSSGRRERASTLPFIHTVYHEFNLVYIRAEGDVDRASVAALQQGLIDAADEVMGGDQIVDLGGVTHVRMTTDDMSALRPKSEELRRTVRPGRLAIVAPTDVTFGLARMYELTFEHSEPARQIMVFRELAEAILWLDLPHPWPPSDPATAT